MSELASLGGANLLNLSSPFTNPDFWPPGPPTWPLIS